MRWNNAPYMTTQVNLGKPWKLLERYVPDLSRTSALWGACYLAKGTYRAEPSPYAERARRTSRTPSVNAISFTSAPGSRTLASWRDW